MTHLRARNLCSLVALGAALAGLLLLAGCATHPANISSARRSAPDSAPWREGEQKANALLNRCGLHAAGSPRVTEEGTCQPSPPNTGDMFEEGADAAARGIGLDPSAHVGEHVWCLNYALEERSAAGQDTMTATFVVTKDAVVTAWLLMGRDYTGGPTALNNDQWQSRR